MKPKPLTLFSALGLAAILVSACGNATPSTPLNRPEALGIQLPEVANLSTPPNPVLPAGNGQASCSPNTSLALLAVLTGANADVGQIQERGAKLAVRQHNQNNPKCQVKLKVFDTEGSPDKAAGVAVQVINDQDILGVIGTSFSGPMQAIGPLLARAGLSNITFASRSSLSQNGWQSFFRGIGNDDVEAPAAARFMLDKLKTQRVFVINDDTEYGRGYGNLVKSTLGDHLVGSDEIIASSTKDYSTTVTKVMGSRANGVFYSGYYPEAAPLFDQLRKRGYTGVLMGGDPLKDNQLVRLAGSAAQNVYMSCACVDGGLIKSFDAAYERAYHLAPGTFAADAYDVATVFLSGIDRGQDSRKKMLTWVKNYDANGLTKHYQWNSHGELSNPKIYFYRVKNSRIVAVSQ